MRSMGKWVGRSRVGNQRSRGTYCMRQGNGVSCYMRQWRRKCWAMSKGSMVGYRMSEWCRV